MLYAQEKHTILITKKIKRSAVQISICDRSVQTLMVYNGEKKERKWSDAKSSSTYAISRTLFTPIYSEWKFVPLIF